MNKVLVRSIRRRRSILMGGAALTLLAYVDVAAADVPPPAGTLPQLANAGGSTVTTSGTAMSIDLNDANRTMDWTTFSVGSDASVAFSTANTSANFTVLNRVTGANLSQIYGRVTSQSNISVWLSNPNGIIFGSTGAFSGGSLVLTTAALNAVPTTGNATLSGMGSSGITLSAATANNGMTGINVTGSLVVAAQAIDVTGRILASGDVVLVAARSVNVPVALGSNVRVTINEGTTIAQGRVAVGAGGAITAGNITLEGATVGGGNDFLLGIDSNATLNATAAGGVVVIAGGTNSTEAPAGSNRVTFDPAIANATMANIDPSGTIRATGAVDMNAVGRIVGTGTVPGAISGNSVKIRAADNVSLANAIRAVGDARVSSNGGTLALSSSVGSTSGNVALAGAGGISLGTAGQTHGLSAGQAVSISANSGDVIAQGDYAIASGLTNTNGSVQINSGGGFALPTTAITAGAEASIGSGYRGDVFLSTSAAGTVPLSLGSVDANIVSTPGTLSTATIGRVGTVGRFTLATSGDLYLDSATSLQGAIALTAGGTISGRAGSGGLMTGFGRTALTAATDGRTITVQGGGIAQLADVRAGTIGVGTATGADQLTVNAAEIDLLTARAATGNLALTATGPGTGTSLLASTLAAPLGNVTIAAGGYVRGQAVASVLIDGLRVGSAQTGSLGVTSGGHARLGTLNAIGDMTVGANGSVTGLSTANDVAAGPGIDITGAGTLTIGSTIAPSARVALGRVDLGGTITVDAIGISAGSIDTAGAVTLRAATGLSVDSLGATTRTGATTLRQATLLSGGEDPAAGLSATKAIHSRLKSSTTARMRKRRPQTKALDMKSRLQRWFGSCGTVIGARVPSARLPPPRWRTFRPSSR